MPINNVVINASPLILLCKSDLENLLTELFDEILVPEAVVDEISRGNDIVSQKLQSLIWLKKVSVRIPDEILIWNLGDGESEVLSFARANREVRAVIDDKAARNCARTLEIKILGTGGILILAKKRGLITSVTDALKKLQDAGLYISDGIAGLLKREAGE